MAADGSAEFVTICNVAKTAKNIIKYHSSVCNMLEGSSRSIKYLCKVNQLWPHLEEFKVFYNLYLRQTMHNEDNWWWSGVRRQWWSGKRFTRRENMWYKFLCLNWIHFSKMLCLQYIAQIFIAYIIIQNSILAHRKWRNLSELMRMTC